MVHLVTGQASYDALGPQFSAFFDKPLWYFYVFRRSIYHMKRFSGTIRRKNILVTMTIETKG